MTDGYKYNPENLFATKIGEHVPLGFSIPTVSLFKSIENKQYMDTNTSNKQ